MKRFTFIAVAVVATATSAVSADEGFFRTRSNASTEYRLPAAPVSHLRLQAPPQKYEDYPAAAYPAGYSSYHGLGYQGSCCESQSVCAQKAWAGYCEPRGYARPNHGLLHGLAACLSRLHCCKRHEACGYQKGCQECAACVPADPCQTGPRHGGLLAALFHCRKAPVGADCCPPSGPWGKGVYGGSMFYGGGYGLSNGYYEGSGGYESQPTPASPEMPAPPEVGPNDPLPPPPPPEATDQSTQYNRLPNSLLLDRSANRPERLRPSTFPQSY